MKGWGIDIAWLDLYATPLLQHQAQFGLTPALTVMTDGKLMQSY